jgi:hypothetical protein
MSKKPQKRRRIPAESTSQKVGRGNPPKHTQFVKGTSGNSKGRPLGSKNVRTIIMDAANDRVLATIDGKQRKISKVRATAMQLATDAARGDPKAVSKLLDWVDNIETRAAAARPAQFPFEAADLEVLRSLHDRMKLYEAQNPGE